MVLEQSPQSSDGYQITHCRLGIFQGTAAALACWHPSSGLPEYGLCRFGTAAKAQAYVDFLCSPACTEPLSRSDLSIEAFDQALHDQLISENPLSSAWELPA